jgi:hypothetical protein
MSFIHIDNLWLQYVKSPNNISKWPMGFNSAFKGLNINEPNNM